MSKLQWCLYEQIKDSRIEDKIRTDLATSDCSGLSGNQTRTVERIVQPRYHVPTNVNKTHLRENRKH